MLVAPLVTVATRVLGVHAAMSIGLVFQCVGFITASFATRIWQLHLTQGVLVGCGIGFLYIPALPVLSQWFLRRRSLANGISAAGSGVGGAAFTWVSSRLYKLHVRYTLTPYIHFLGYRGHHPSMGYQLGSTHYWCHCFRRRSGCNRHHTRQKQCYSTKTTWLRYQTSSTIRRAAAPCLGFHQYARVRSASVFLSGFCAIDWLVSIASYRHRGFAARGNRDWSTDYWDPQRQVESYRHSRCSNATLRSILLCLLAARNLVRAYNLLRHTLRSHRWSILDGEQRAEIFIVRVLELTAVDHRATLC